MGNIAYSSFFIIYKYLSERSEAKMSSNRVTLHIAVENFCKQNKVKYKDMVKLIRPLLKNYFLGRSEENNIKELVTIDARKEAVRRKFIKMARNPDAYSDTDKAVFAVAVACCSWYQELSAKLLAKMERKVPEGKELVYILKCVYLEGDGRTDVSMLHELSMSSGTYNRRKDDAIALYGTVILEYAVRREKEDVAAGIVPPPDFEL